MGILDPLRRAVDAVKKKLPKIRIAEKEGAGLLAVEATYSDKPEAKPEPLAAPAAKPAVSPAAAVPEATKAPAPPAPPAAAGDSPQKDGHPAPQEPAAPSSAEDIAAARPIENPEAKFFAAIDKFSLEELKRQKGDLEKMLVLLQKELSAGIVSRASYDEIRRNAMAKLHEVNFELKAISKMMERLKGKKKPARAGAAPKKGKPGKKGGRKKKVKR